MFFNHLYGPVFTHFVKEFWRFAEVDKRYIVSYVLGRKIVNTKKKSITILLGMEGAKGKSVFPPIIIPIF